MYVYIYIYTYIYTHIIMHPNIHIYIYTHILAWAALRARRLRGGRRAAPLPAGQV